MAPKGLAAEQGFLLIADISGYSGYVIESPLEYAEDVVADVTRAVSDHLQHVFRVNKIEGDAVFAYAREADPSMLLDTVEECYFVFRSRLESIEHSTSCTCSACTKVPELDLKFVIHHGNFICRPRSGGEELTGQDVILVHRLLKNAVAETLGKRGYALLTEACVTKLGIDPVVLGMREHDETYADVGDVRAFVVDLEERFADWKERRRVFVSPADAAFEVEVILPVPPPVVWEYLTSPDKRMSWREHSVEQATIGGRRCTGTTSYCVDGRAAVYEEILDWRPFDYFTESRTLQGATKLVLTTQLEATDDGTCVKTRGRRLRGKERPAWLIARPRVVRSLRDGYSRLAAILPAAESLARSSAS